MRIDRLALVKIAVAAFVAAFGAPAFAASLSDKARNDLVDVIPDDDPAMAKAVVEARASLPAFLAKASDPKPGTRGYAVKVGIGLAGNKEFVWIAPFVVRGDVLTGQIANEPERVKGYAAGQTLKISLSDVTDWTYLEGAKMRGNYSACALLSRKTDAEKAEFHRQYDLDCAAP